MRRAVSSLIAAMALAGSFAVAAPAPVSAQECEGMGCARSNYERTRDLPAYGSRYDGYWDRRGEPRRRGYGYRYHDDRYVDGRGYHYYPGYGYYPDRADDRGDRRDGYDRGGYDRRDGDTGDPGPRRRHYRR